MILYSTHMNNRGEQQQKVGSNTKPNNHNCDYSLHSEFAMKLGCSPWQRYSSQTDANPQSFLSRIMSSVNVEPGDPINTFDMAQIVLSSMASTFGKTQQKEAKRIFHELVSSKYFSEKVFITHPWPSHKNLGLNLQMSFKKLGLKGFFFFFFQNIEGGFRNFLGRHGEICSA